MNLNVNKFKMRYHQHNYPVLSKTTKHVFSSTKFKRTRIFLEHLKQWVYCIPWKYQTKLSCKASSFRGFHPEFENYKVSYVTGSQIARFCCFLQWNVSKTQFVLRKYALHLIFKYENSKFWNLGARFCCYWCELSTDENERFNHQLEIGF